MGVHAAYGKLTCCDSKTLLMLLPPVFLPSGDNDPVDVLEMSPRVAYPGEVYPVTLVPCTSARYLVVHQ